MGKVVVKNKRLINRIVVTSYAQGMVDIETKITDTIITAVNMALSTMETNNKLSQYEKGRIDMTVDLKSISLFRNEVARILKRGISINRIKDYLYELDDKYSNIPNSDKAKYIEVFFHVLLKDFVPQ